jgi:hypothetical protein
MNVEVTIFPRLSITPLNEMNNYAYYATYKRFRRKTNDPGKIPN